MRREPGSESKLLLQRELKAGLKSKQEDTRVYSECLTHTPSLNDAVRIQNGQSQETDNRK